MFKRELEVELSTLLPHLDVPESRKTNLDWLNRNLSINNRDEKGKRAQEIVHELLRIRGREERGQYAGER